MYQRPEKNNLMVILKIKEREPSSYPLSKFPSGRMVAMSQEYDLHLAFDSERERNTFQTLIIEYAKKR